MKTYAHLLDSDFFQCTPFALPFITVLAYILFLKYIGFRKRNLVMFSIVLFIMSIILNLISVKIFFPKSGSTVFSIFYVLYVYTVAFPLMEYSFRRNWVNNDEKFYRTNNPSLADSKLTYYPNPKKVIYVGFVSRYSMFTSFIILITIFMTAAVIDSKYSSVLIKYLALVFLGVSSVFMISMSFLRLLVKCPSCHLDIYKLDLFWNAYHDTAKHAVKDKIIECYSCHATYILDPNMDFEQAKVNAKKIAEIRKKRLQAIEDIQAGRK